MSSETPNTPPPPPGYPTTPPPPPAAVNGVVPTVVIDKNLHVWIFAFLLGGFGLDRFMRGQIGIGVAKLLLNWLTLGIWALVDWIIAMVKAYGSSYGQDRDFSFDQKGKYMK